MSLRSRDLLPSVRHPAFLTVLGLKLAASCFLGGALLRYFFIPFVNQFVQSHFANPWDHFASLGLVKAFPYAPLMLYVFTVPRVLLAPLMASTDLFTVTSWHFLAMRLPLLLADVAIYLVLAAWAGPRSRRAL